MLGREQLDVINKIYDDAVLRHGKDHIAAAADALDELRALEAGGHQWVATVLDAFLMQGVTRKIKERAKRSVISVPSKTGVNARMPAAYSRKGADGSQQLVLWLDAKLDELQAIIDGLAGQAGVLLQRKGRMQLGYDLAVKHGAETAREGFTAEGIEITTADEAAA